MWRPYSARTAHIAVGEDRKWFFWYWCVHVHCTFCDSSVCTSVQAQFTRGCTLQHFVIVPCVSQSEHSYPNISVSQPRSIFHFWLYATSQPNQHKSHTMETCYFVNLVLKSKMIPQIYSSILGHIISRQMATFLDKGNILIFLKSFCSVKCLSPHNKTSTFSSVTSVTRRC